MNAVILLHGVEVDCQPVSFFSNVHIPVLGGLLQYLIIILVAPAERTVETADSCLPN